MCEDCEITISWYKLKNILDTFDELKIKEYEMQPDRLGEGISFETKEVENIKYITIKKYCEEAA